MHNIISLAIRQVGELEALKLQSHERLKKLEEKYSVISNGKGGSSQPSEFK